MHTKKNNTHQSIGTRTFRINATNAEEASNLAEDISGNYIFEKTLIEEYDIEDYDSYPTLPQSYEAKENNTNPTNSIYGFNVEVTRIGCSSAKGTSEFASNYIITNCEKQDKPYFYCDAESSNSPIIKIPLQFYLQNNDDSYEFQKQNILDLLKERYNCLNTSDEKLYQSINTMVSTDYEINQNNTYEGVIIKSPRWTPTCEDPFVILLISDKNNNIIINQNMKIPILNNNYLNDIISQYKRDLLDHTIAPKTNNKKSLKI